MKTIGIKLADGSFYPVLNEGAPSERLLELTTAHNNQTKVMVDLYRSELGSMEDAEYVDSLQIEDLNEHPNGEPTLTFTVSIDENNKLSAKMVDNETGLQSNATITLVSRTLEERLLPDEYDIKDPTLEGMSLTQTEENSLFGNDEKETSADDENPLVDFSFETEPNPTFDVINEFEAPVDETSVGVEEEIPAEIEEEAEVQEEVPADETIPEASVEEPITESAAEAEPEVQPENPVEESLSENTFEAEPEVQADDTIEEEIPESEPEADAEIPEISDFNPLSQPVLEDDALAIDEFNTEDESSEKPDFTFDIPDDTVQNSEEEAVREESQASEEINPSEDFVSDLPSFDFSSISDSSGDLDLTETDSTEVKEEELNLDLDLPDFDSIPDSPEEESNTTTESFNSDLDLSDLDTFTQTETPADDNSYLDDLDFDDLDSTSQPAQSTGKPISFTGLYDKETELGNSAASEAEEGKTRPAVIICVLCAIICILATIFVLMVVPSKFSLFGNKKAAKEDAAKTELSVTELPPEKPAPAPAFVEAAPEAEPIAEPEPLPPVPASKEEEVLVIENAEDVVPLPPPVKPVKPKDINYKIKWGDTLWDISDTYYKNPWRYKYIARYNGIKNPDYIISGTYITIPAE